MKSVYFGNVIHKCKIRKIIMWAMLLIRNGSVDNKYLGVCSKMSNAK